MLITDMIKIREVVIFRNTHREKYPLTFKGAKELHKEINYLKYKVIKEDITNVSGVK